MPKKPAHLLGFIQHGVNSHATGMWRHPKDKINWDWSRPAYWQHMARTMERGLFDAIFIADELAPYNNYEGSSDATVKYAVQCPVHEPSTIVPILTTATTHIGVGVTLSTAFEHPYSMVRRLSSLDHLSGGRVAWNIVSSYSKSEWDAYGAEMTNRSGRYERMEEYMELCYKLWDSWEPDAIVADRESGVFADPDEGPRSRSRRRVLSLPRTLVRVPIAAGAPGALAGRLVRPRPRFRRQTRRGDLRRASECRADAGIYRRSRSAPRDEVRSRAGQRQAHLRRADGRRADPQRGARRNTNASASAFRSKARSPGSRGHFGPDFSKYDPNEIVQNIEIPGIQGLFDSIIYAKGGAPVTVREAALIYAEGMGMPRLVGTPADIADQLEHFIDAGGADGFMLAATYTPGCFEEFVDLVVPELQRRGRYRTAYSGATLRENLLAN